MTSFPFIDGDFNGQSISFDGQRTVNLYLEASESGTSKSPAMLIGTPGLSLFATLGAGPIKGMIRISATQSVVISGETAYLLNSNGTSVALMGSILSSNALVVMAWNGSLVMAVAGQYGYFINPATQVVTAITDPDFYGGDRVDFVDGYFVWNRPGTGQFQTTNLYGSDIDGLDFATAEGLPDNLVTTIVDHRELWLLGETSIEVYINTGDPDFAFSRIQGAFLEIGCAAKFSVAKADNSIMWLASDDRGYGTIQRASGYSSQRVSNHAVENAINNYVTIDDAIAWTYSSRGHTFYVISFPTARASWCMDAATGRWHERLYRESDGTMTQHRGQCQMNLANTILVGDYQNGKVYALDDETYSDDGAAIIRLRASPHLSADLRQQFFSMLEVDFQRGVGLVTGQGSDPVALLRWSDDGGFTWSNQLTATMGRMGEYKARARWRRLGRARDRVWEVSVSDPVKVVMIGAHLNARVGTS